MHRLVAGQDGAQRVDGGVAELGGDGEQVVRARRPAGLAALDVASDERRDREVLLGQLDALVPVGMTVVDRRCASSRSARSGHDPAAGMTFQIRACSR